TTICGFFGGGDGFGDACGSAPCWSAGILPASSFLTSACMSFGIADIAGLFESCGALWTAGFSGAFITSAVFPGVDDGDATGFGGVYCSMITGVAMLSVGSRRSLAIAALLSIASGSSC